MCGETSQAIRWHNQGVQPKGSIKGFNQRVLSKGSIIGFVDEINFCGGVTHMKHMMHMMLYRLMKLTCESHHDLIDYTLHSLLSLHEYLLV